MRTDLSGQGIINILAADQLMLSPKLYATFLLWLLSELFEDLPEVGDPPKPKLVFFFDEAHLLFEEAPKALLDKVEQVVRLIRSKGVGVYFISQNPLDIPDDVLGQLGNRVQHALRAFTPRDQKAVRAAAETFRANPEFDAAEAITQLGVGEALVSTLQDKGIPSVVERSLIRPPCSRIGPATPEERQAVIEPQPARRPLRPDGRSRVGLRDPEEEGGAGARPRGGGAGRRRTGARPPPTRGAHERLGRPAPAAARSRQTVGEAMAKSVARSIGSQIGRQIVRGILGSLPQALSAIGGRGEESAERRVGAGIAALRPHLMAVARTRSGP